MIYKDNIDYNITGYKQKCYLPSCEKTFKYCFWYYKKSLDRVKQKNDTEIIKEVSETKKHIGTGKPK